MITSKAPYIESTYQQLQIISQHRQKHLEYEAIEKTVRNHNYMMFEAKESEKNYRFAACDWRSWSCRNMLCYTRYCINRRKVLDYLVYTFLNAAAPV